MEEKNKPLEEKRRLEEQKVIDIDKAKFVYDEKDLREAVQNILKDFNECRDKTDVWADEERWNRFERIFKSRIKRRFGKSFFEEVQG